MKELTKASIDRYVEHRIPTGGFLEAVLSNDLMGAVGRADAGNLRDLHEICSYVYNRIPSGCWGSPEKVRAWLNREDED